MSARRATLLLLVAVMLPAHTAHPVSAQAPAAVPAQRFSSAENAVQAFVAALRGEDTKALLRIFGSEGRTLVVSGDPVADRQARAAFVTAYDAGHRLAADGNAMILHVGDENWPFPIPVVKDGARWRFDVRQGREEVIARRVGRNELNTVQVCLAYVDAQREYYAEDRNGDGILEYAQRFVSSAGRHDGLYWPSAPGERPSPLGELVVRAQARGYDVGKSTTPTPFHGYLFRILTAQGPAAPDGAYDYIVRGHMMAGFGLVAFPAQYGVSGVMTFIVNQDGVVYQKDLGPKTATTAGSLRRFDPDTTWTRVEEVLR
jgi:hypothetical protein